MTNCMFYIVNSKLCNSPEPAVFLKHIQGYPPSTLPSQPVPLSQFTGIAPRGTVAAFSCSNHYILVDVRADLIF
jgi:hypothetical protein